jgi:hypothetical protein
MHENPHVLDMLPRWQNNLFAELRKHPLMKTYMLYCLSVPQLLEHYHKRRSRIPAPFELALITRYLWQ